MQSIKSAKASGDHPIFWFFNQFLPLTYDKFNQTNCCPKLIWMRSPPTNSLEPGKKTFAQMWWIFTNFTSSVTPYTILEWTCLFIRSIELSQRNLRAYNFHTTKRLKRTFARELIDESNAMGYKNMSLIFEKIPFPCRYWNWIEKIAWTVLVSWNGCVQRTAISMCAVCVKVCLKRKGVGAQRMGEIMFEKKVWWELKGWENYV